MSMLVRPATREVVTGRQWVGGWEGTLIVAKDGWFALRPQEIRIDKTRSDAKHFSLVPTSLPKLVVS